MRSIRLSLIVYFLVLLTAALGAVSWFSYQTTAESLRERQRDAQMMIQAQYKAREKTARAELDRRLVAQARAMASLRLVTIPYEAVYSSTAIAEGAMLQGMPGLCLGAPLWLPYAPPIPFKEGAPPPPTPPYVPLLWGHLPKTKFDPSRDISRFYPRFTHLDSSEALIAEGDAGQAQEYFQTYRGTDGQPMQRSESMGNSWFTLDNERRENAVRFKEEFDEVELKPGVRVRRVTLMTPVSGFGGVVFGPWRGGLGQNPKGAKQPPRPIDTLTVFIQYAGDLGPVEAKIHQFQRQRDQQIAELETTINRDLKQLRSRMMWIGFSALAAVWLGGYLMIRLGLAPLAKMSDAVSKVSAQNFHLPLETKTLPNELLPIAERLVDLLDHLQKAFAREKQAAADISHELRTPLAALMTTLEVGLKKPRSPDEYREILDECRSSGQHMYQLVERLLTLARLDAGVDQYRPAETDVTELALACADLIRPLAKARGLALRLHLSDPITTETDPNKLREVLTNLLHNAVEYNKDHGAIDLTIERTNSRIRFEVRDTGIGIKPEQRERLFERFYRADPSRHADTPHAGLGLAIVKSYVDLMGGTIQVETSDAGTAFIVELPYTASIHDVETVVREAPVMAQR